MLTILEVQTPYLDDDEHVIYRLARFKEAAPSYAWLKVKTMLRAYVFSKKKLSMFMENLINNNFCIYDKDVCTIKT